MSYREERRADQAAKREQDREDLRLRLEADREAERLRAEEKRKDAEARRRQEQAERKQREAERVAKKAAAAAKRAKLRRWLKNNPATVFVAYVMVASIVPAVISQVAALVHGGVYIVLAALLASMLEGGAWAITFMGKQAEDAGRPTAKYRAGTWVTAGVAAVIQLWHWAEIAPLWVALVFAGSSLFAIWIWDLKTHGSHAKTHAERKRERAQEKHEKDRRKHHKEIVEQAEKLQAAMPFGTLSDEQAFAAAWRIHTGAEPGLSAELYATATNAVAALGAAFELGEHVRPELIETGLKAAQLNPFKALPTGPTPHAGIDLYAPENPSPEGEENPHGDAPKGRSEEELK